MEHATILQFLRQYTTDIPVSIQQGVIENILYDMKNFQEVTFVARFKTIVPYTDILKFEEVTSLALQIQ